MEWLRVSLLDGCQKQIGNPEIIAADKCIFMEQIMMKNIFRYSD